MAWDFSTDPDFQAHLDWMQEFVREEIWPLEVLGNVRWGVICVIQAQRPTLEHYAIGRRACEPEWDLLGMIGPP